MLLSFTMQILPHNKIVIFNFLAMSLVLVAAVKCMFLSLMQCKVFQPVNVYSEYALSFLSTIGMGILK